jgi:carbohydrate kinase (thermoresistant glucokinase family)
MGVSGSGKTTVATALARRTGWPFLEGDTLHPPENIARMAAGTPLTDADRWPWLAAVAEWIRDQPGPAVVACSALKRAYRDLLRQAAPDLLLVYLRVEREVLAARLAARQGHYMKRVMLDSQLNDLSEPGPDEGALVVPAVDPTAAVDLILAALLRPAAPGATE